MKSYEEKSEMLKALANPARMEIVIRLEKDGCNVSTIQENLGLPQSTISQHLKILKNAGLITRKRDGTKICYKVKCKEVRDIVRMLDKI